MRKVFYHKLIRDKIPQVINASGGEYEIRVMEKEEFEKELKKKLVEESKELVKAPKEELLNEMADVLELLQSLSKHFDIDFKLVEKERVKKYAKRGGFDKKLFLVWSSCPK